MGCPCDHLPTRQPHHPHFNPMAPLLSRALPTPTPTKQQLVGPSMPLHVASKQTDHIASIAWSSSSQDSNFSIESSLNLILYRLDLITPLMYAHIHSYLYRYMKWKINITDSYIYAIPNRSSKLILMSNYFHVDLYVIWILF